MAEPANLEEERDLVSRMRHSTTHIMAEAVLEMFPDAKWAIGPVIDDGFYYDFLLPRPLTNEDLPEIENRMRSIIEKHVDFTWEQWPADRAREFYKEQPFKLDLIDDIGEAQVGICTQNDFVDLCRGHHVENSREIGAFKLLSIAGAYWRGSEKNAMLTRIYGTVWATQAELDAHLERLEDQKRRDHRRIGRDLNLFMTSDDVGAGLPLWLPKGSAIRRVLEDYIVELERRQGYQHVYTPDIAKRELYVTSGHWDHYKDAMFPVMSADNEEFVLRPMNCPHHIEIYKAGLHSYRELPIKFAELGTMYRYEKSGELLGLSRVRVMTLNDGHIFCTPDQIKSEFAKVIELIKQAYRDLGLDDYSFRLSLREKGDTEKFVGNDEMWELGERVLKEALDEIGVDYVESVGDAAFYGPKLDVQVKTAAGKEETLSTIQLDFHLPEQFQLEYVGEDGQPRRPVIIHRSVISTMERMIALLIEQFLGAFPTWLAPVQAIVIPIADRHNDFAGELCQRMVNAGLRVEVNSKSERMNAKIRDAQNQKIPYMLVVGDREIEADSAAVRLRSGENLGATPIDDIIERISKESSDRDPHAPQP